MAYEQEKRDWNEKMRELGFESSDVFIPKFKKYLPKRDQSIVVSHLYTPEHSVTCWRDSFQLRASIVPGDDRGGIVFDKMECHTGILSLEQTQARILSFIALYDEKESAGVEKSF